MQPFLAVLLLYVSPSVYEVNFFIGRQLSQTRCYQNALATSGDFSRFGDTRFPSSSFIINHAFPVETNYAQPRPAWSIYPVPVEDLLQLRYEGKEPIRGVINVIIRHINGRVFHKLRFASLTRHIQIPVSNLGSGTYQLTIVINDKVEWNQRFVK